MNSVKANVIRMIEALPEEASVSDIMEELYFRQQVEEGFREPDAGQGFPHEEVAKRMQRFGLREPVGGRSRVR